MRRSFGSYFGWARGSDSGASTPTSKDATSRRTSRQLSWQSSPTDGKISPFRSLDEMQECFWIEDNLRHTGHQLDTCSERLRGMSDSASHIREELEGLQTMLASMKMREDARRDSKDPGPKDSTECPPEKPLLSEAQTVESSPAPAQFYQEEESSTEPTSYTTSPIQPDGQSEEAAVEISSAPQHAPEYVHFDPAILDNIEEEHLLLDSVSEPTLAAPNSAGDDQKTNELEAQQQAPLAVQSTPSQQHDPPQNTPRVYPEHEEHQQNFQSVKLTPSAANYPLQTIVEMSSNEAEHQRTPRSMRPNPVQKRFPLASGSQPFIGKPRTTHTLVAKRASLKPVIGQKKVSQMTQFWSQRETNFDA